MSSLTEGIENQGERTGRGNRSEQENYGAKRLPASDIEGGSGEHWKGLLDELVVRGPSRGEPGWRRSGRLVHTDSVAARQRAAKEA
jgi:hypothetical protein